MRIKVVGGAEEEQENINVLEIDFQKAMEVINTGKTKDGKTIILLQYAKIYDLLYFLAKYVSEIMQIFFMAKVKILI
jgi:hypothetical protein